MPSSGIFVFQGTLDVASTLVTISSYSWIDTIFTYYTNFLCSSHSNHVCN